ncbi:imelysin family protein [Neptunomonas qingdaonensis]|uniref:Predicted lipoprotein n=1 Tax=Neptunomonas qingdaonensis TaxID=1045558 RepID=A0A1I2LLV8_9GAMM|nr:imelysin family protein [Neptunomonas qingdaonensis]SFF79440.1 Predicted lipoprotein [Neptunomonas qingdaonensis]
MQPSHSLTPVLLSLSLFLFGVGVVHAAPTEEQWSELNNVIIGQHLSPRYLRLADNSLAMSEQLKHLCEAPTDQQLDAAQQSFNRAQASWQGVQHIQFGPVTLLMRNYSLQYWPDKKNIGAKQLSAILAATEASFDDEFFRSASISVKGFPALERLLFADDKQIQDRNAVECRLANAIAEHIYDTAQAIHSEWTEEARSISLASNNTNTPDTDTEAEIESGFEEYLAYETPSEAATEFMKSLVEPIEAIRDNKLLKPLDTSAQQSRWKKSESWRSGQSINNIQENIIALHELYSGTHPVSVKTLLEASNDSERAADIETSFKMITAQLAQLPAITQMNITAQMHQQLMQVSDHLKTLQNHLELAMQTLNIQLGFNSRDGD